MNVAILTKIIEVDITVHEGTCEWICDKHARGVNNELGKNHITTSCDHELQVLKLRIPVMTVHHIQRVCRNRNP